MLKLDPNTVAMIKKIRTANTATRSVIYPYKDGCRLFEGEMGQIGRAWQQAGEPHIFSTRHALDRNRNQE